MKVFELFEHSQITHNERDALEFAEDLVHLNGYSIADAMGLVRTNFEFTEVEIQRIRQLFMERNRDLL